MSLVKLGLCSSRRGGFRQGPAQSSLQNAVEFYCTGPVLASPGRKLTLAKLDSTAEDLELSIQEALKEQVTHVFFLSPRVLLPFYALERLFQLRVKAVSGISWTWREGQAGEGQEIYPRIGYFDSEGRAFPYFGWSAPDIFQADWCGLDCLLLEREALEEIAELLILFQDWPPALRISQSLRSRKIPIIIDSFIQCPQVITSTTREGRKTRKLIPNLYAWREFSRDFPNRRIPRGRVYDPAYRGRIWYRNWLGRCHGTFKDEDAAELAAMKKLN